MKNVKIEFNFDDVRFLFCIDCGRHDGNGWGEGASVSCEMALQTADCGTSVRCFMVCETIFARARASCMYRFQ
ncbi:MAG: hypothetical protein HDR57_00660 [Treponema sp.]|nr:hypothetical protein [Treponema sp.]